MKMVVVVVGFGGVRRLLVVLKAGERSLNVTARYRYPSSSLPPNLCLNQFLLCFFVIWGQLGGFWVVLRSRSAVVFSSVMLSSLSLGVKC